MSSSTAGSRRDRRGGPASSTDRLLERLDTAWAAFQESYAGLPDTALLEPGVVGDWSVKDVLAHVSWWEAEALKYLPTIMQGERPPRYATLYGGIDAFNALMAERKRGLSLDEVRKESAETHRRLVGLVRNAPEGQLASETRARRRLRQDTYGHYPEHTTAIRAWRERRSAR